MSSELEERIEEESRAQWNKSNEEIKIALRGQRMILKKTFPIQMIICLQ